MWSVDPATETPNRDFSFPRIERQHRPRGEAWREKALGRTVALTCIVLGHTVTCYRCCSRRTRGSRSASRHRPIAFSRKGLPLGLVYYESCGLAPILLESAGTVNGGLAFSRRIDRISLKSRCPPPSLDFANSALKPFADPATDRRRFLRPERRGEIGDATHDF